MAKWTAMWMGSIASFIIFVMVTQLMIVDWPGEPGDAGIKLAHTEDLQVSGIHFYVDTTHNPTNIFFEAVVNLEGHQEDEMLFVVLPYAGNLTESSDWKWRPFEKSTLLVKTFDCSQNSCSFSDSNQFFNFELDNRIDQKQSAHHSVRLWFHESSPLLDPDVARLVRQYNEEQKQYHVGFDEMQNTKATIRLDKTSDSFGITPNAPIVPGPGGEMFQLDWDIKSGILHQIDYQIPSERNLENQMINYTALFGIGLGITNLAIYGAQQRSQKLKDQQHDKYPKDAIDEDKYYRNGDK